MSSSSRPDNRGQSRHQGSGSGSARKGGSKPAASKPSGSRGKPSGSTSGNSRPSNSRPSGTRSGADKSPADQRTGGSPNKSSRTATGSSRPPSDRNRRSTGDRKPSSPTQRRDSGPSGARKSAPRSDSSVLKTPEDFRDGLGEIDVSILPRDVLRDLEVLNPGVRARAERWLAAARMSLEEDPAQALEYAQEAGRIGGRSSVVREAVGVAAYQSGEFATARKELQAARRIGGRDDLLPLLADCERALGNPRKAVDLANSPEGKSLRGESQAELLLVAAGARLDLEQTSAAVALLRGPCSQTPQSAPWAARLFYGYADALLANGQVDDARDWFLRAASADVDGLTDASERIDDLDAPSD